MAEEPHIRLRYQCSPYYVNSAFYPIITQLERAAQFTRDDTPAQKLDKLEALLGQGTAQVAEIASLFATLLAIPLGDRYPSLSLTPQRQKEKIIEALVDQIIGFARQQPVLFIWEDIHWCDPTSLEVLDFLMHHVTKTRTLVVITYRPEFEPPWREFAHVTTYTLNRLTRREVTTLVDGVTGGKALPDEVLDQIAVKTDGVPLFVEELTKTVLESGLLHEADNHYALSGPLPPLAIPSTLQDALMARLDRLASVKEVAQIGATLGREFTYELVAVVSSLQDATLQDALDQLVSAELLVQRGTPPAVSYLFKHALVQDTAYTSLLKSRRQQLHTRIAQVLEAQFPITAETEPEVLAHRYTAAGLGEQAIGYWHQAGQKASAQSAYVEAIAHLTRGLEVVTTLADTPNRTEHELQLQLVLGDALAATKSYAAPEVGHAYSRAWTLGQQLPESPQSFTALFSLWRFRHNEAELQAARQLAEELLHLAQSRQSSLYRMHAHLALGCTLFYRGDFVETQAHVEQSLTLAAQQPSDVWAEVAGTRVASLLYAAYVLWYRGYANQAVDRMRTAIRLAQDMQHPFTLGFAHTVSCQFSQSMRDPHKTYTEADALIAFSMEQEFPMWQARATVPRGWALAVQEGTEEGITQMHQGLDALERMGARVLRTHELAQLAEGYGQDEQIEAGLRTLAEALALAAQTEERFVEAELYRLKGELLLASSLANQMKAEASFQQALDVARNQQAKSLELRAATSLARLWQQQGKCQDAYDLLAPIYNWFTEGFDTADLHEAKALLDELSAEIGSPTA